MERYKIIQTIGESYITSNIEGGEYSYAKEAGGKKQPEYLAVWKYDTTFVSRLKLIAMVAERLVDKHTVYYFSGNVIIGYLCDSLKDKE